MSLDFGFLGGWGYFRGTTGFVGFPGFSGFLGCFWYAGVLCCVVGEFRVFWVVFGVFWACCFPQLSYWNLSGFGWVVGFVAHVEFGGFGCFVAFGVWWFWCFLGCW